MRQSRGGVPPEIPLTSPGVRVPQVENRWCRVRVRVRVNPNPNPYNTTFGYAARLHVYLTLIMPLFFLQSYSDHKSMISLHTMDYAIWLLISSLSYLSCLYVYFKCIFFYYFVLSPVFKLWELGNVCFYTREVHKVVKRLRTELGSWYAGKLLFGIFWNVLCFSFRIRETGA